MVSIARRDAIWRAGMLTLPNILTLSRIFAVPLLVWPVVVAGLGAWAMVWPLACIA